MHHCSTICSYEYWKSRHKKKTGRTLYISRQYLFQDVSRYIKYVQTSVELLQAWPFGCRDITHKIFNIQTQLAQLQGEMQKKKRKTNGNYKQFRSLPHNIKPPQKPRFWQEFTQTNGTIQWGCSILQRWDYVKHVFEVSILAPIILTTKNGGQNTWTSSENTWIR